MSSIVETRIWSTPHRATKYCQDFIKHIFTFYELNMEIKNTLSGVFEAALSNGYHIFKIPPKNFKYFFLLFLS